MDACPDKCYFVTLTYNDESLPHNMVYHQFQDSAELVPTVRKSDVQKLHMDMRKRFQQGFFFDDTLVRLGVRLTPSRIPLDPDAKWRFYLTSEYGPEGHRPHYHALYFGLPEDPNVTFCLFESLWKKGFVYCEKAISDKAAAYVGKYLINSSLVPVHREADRPFSLMSKGLGSGYLDSSLVDWHREAPRERSYFPVKDQKAVLSRYLRDKIFDDDMKAAILDDAVRREDIEKARIDSLDPVSKLMYYEDLKHKEEEAIRQAEWRFIKKGKIK